MSTATINDLLAAADRVETGSEPGPDDDNHRWFVVNHTHADLVFPGRGEPRPYVVPAGEEVYAIAVLARPSTQQDRDALSRFHRVPEDYMEAYYMQTERSPLDDRDVMVRLMADGVSHGEVALCVAVDAYWQMMHIHQTRGFKMAEAALLALTKLIPEATTVEEAAAAMSGPLAVLGLVESHINTLNESIITPALLGPLAAASRFLGPMFQRCGANFLPGQTINVGLYEVDPMRCGGDEPAVPPKQRKVQRHVDILLRCYRKTTIGQGRGPLPRRFGGEGE